MTIKTSTFGGVTLTGKAAIDFEKQFLTNKPKPNVAAKNSLKRGREILKGLQMKGYFLVKPKNDRYS